VIEGHIDIEDRATEGPFGEYPGYLVPDAIAHELVGRVTAISSVAEPILATVPAGKPVDDDHTISVLGQSVGHTRVLREAGLPVDYAWVVPEGANQFAVISVTEDWQAGCDSDPQALIHRLTDTLIENSPPTMALARILVVENDIDPTDLRDVMWALASRVRPGSDLVVTDRPLASLSPLFTPHERETGRGPLVVHNGLIAGAATR
ncbi:UbiD family decarboxylase domain-containing protein, partial [Nocardia gipuzkoensis]